MKKNGAEPTGGEREESAERENERVEGSGTLYERRTQSIDEMSSHAKVARCS